MSSRADIQAFFDEATHTVSYLVSDPSSRQAAIIDPVLDYDHRSGQASMASADCILAAAQSMGLRVVWILETHAHADHLSAAPYLKRRTGAAVAIGEHIREVQRVLGPVFNLTDLSGDGSEFDRLFRDGEIFSIGTLSVEVLHTPGHTPACVSYRIGDAVFVGDTLFMPDYGTARADFPGGSAHALYRSIRRLMALPPQTRLFTCHDYQAQGRTVYAWESTVAEQRQHNVHVRDGIDAEAFAQMRQSRDAALPMPALLLPAIQVNLRAGRLPRAEANGVRYLKIPIALAQEDQAGVAEKKPAVP